MEFNLQPTLENEKVILLPLKEEDFELVHKAASNPEVWAEHPNKNRWQEDVFRNFFKGALRSGGAFKIIDKASGNVIGSTRFYDYDRKKDSILIGYTFFAKEYWNQGYNHAAKRLMLDYIFDYVSVVHLHIGAENERSKRSITNLGARKIAEEVVAYYGEPPRLNFLYEIRKEEWRGISSDRMI